MAVKSPLTAGACICVTYVIWADLRASALHTEAERPQGLSGRMEQDWKDGDLSRGFLPWVDRRLSDGSVRLNKPLKSMAALSLMLAPSGNVVPGLSIGLKRNSSGIWSRMFGAGKLSTKKRASPFIAGKPGVTLDLAVKMALASGRTWSTTKIEGHFGIARAVLDIKAPPAVVWRQLLDQGAYARKVPGCVRSEVLKKSSSWGLGGFTETTYLRQVSRPFPGFRLVAYQENVYEPGKSSMTLSLDENRKSDFDDFHGHWHVKKHPRDASKSRLFFEIAIVAPRWVPNWIITAVARRGILDLTAWVKRYSEKEWSLAN